MEYLRLEQVSKSYGEKILFKDLDFTISKGEKIALIAKNGSGKSTLLRIIASVEAPEGERARVILNRHIKAAFLDQDPSFEGHKTIEEIFYDVQDPRVKAIKRYEASLANGDPDEMSTALSLMDEHRAWDIEARAEEILSKLKLTPLDQIIDSLSGGQIKRLALAKLIFSEPEFIILDEPTNHLDVDMIEWLEKYLSGSQITLFMVTHDRYFLENICNEILELDGGTLFPYKGNYSEYLEKKAMRSLQENSAIDKVKKNFVKELEWVRRQPKARTTKAKSRVDGFEVLKEKVSSIQYDDPFEIEVDAARLGKKIVEFVDVSKSFGDKKILDGFWYKFNKGERIGINGPNGSGKTTFIKLLTEELRPDTGKIIIGDTVQFGHYTQAGIQLDEDKRVIDVIRDIAEYIPLAKGLKLSAGALLENFMFSRSQQQVYVSQLSGGERKRLHLLQVLVKNPNFLILDEPTNDLDILTLQVLEAYLEKFPGCLVIISHDRFFMDKLVQHMFIFNGDGQIDDYLGNYSQWRENRSKYPMSSDADSIKHAVYPSKTDRSEVAPIKRLSYLEKQEMNNIERKLENVEKRKAEIEKLFVDCHLPSQDINRLSQELATLKSEGDNLELRWLELSESV